MVNLGFNINDNLTYIEFSFNIYNLFIFYFNKFKLVELVHLKFDFNGIKTIEKILQYKFVLLNLDFCLHDVC